MRAIDCKLPFEAEIAFGPTTGVFRYDRNEQRAGLDLLSDRVVPGVAAAQFALVEPHLDARGAQGPADALGGRCILGGVAEENGVIGFVHDYRVVVPGAGLIGNGMSEIRACSAR